jgi:hypothetical protein
MGEDLKQLPKMRILVVADIDLPSASALAEYALQQEDNVFDSTMIDLCIACGSFCRDEDLLPYLRGKQRRRELSREYHASSSTTPSLSSTPFFRSREETAALEGLMTAALSQLESIVCRVVYCPGMSDPLSTLLSEGPRRLTPNSRNLHKQWLPLAPGIGCAALLYLDSPEKIIDQRDSVQGQIFEDDDASENEDEEVNEIVLLTDKLSKLQQR